ncbi:MAG TPA: hypothetical protein VJL87_04510 [Bdellovibrionota bacterium]|nr:hypothetical protein [Bdellovibrionota bacterium]
MKNKLFLIFSILILSTQSAIAEKNKLSMPELTPAVLTGTTLGFGIGHAFLGEYKRVGWKFTAAEVASLSAFIAGSTIYFSGFSGNSMVNGIKTVVKGEPPTYDNINPTNLATMLMVTGTVGFLVARVWEGVDILKRKPKIPSLAENPTQIALLTW